MTTEKERNTAESSTSSIEGCFTTEIVKTMVESVSYDKPADDVLQFLADDLTFKVKLILQEAVKFQNAAKRRKLDACNIDCALRVKNVEPVYGFTSADFAPFRHASGGGRDVYFHEEEELDLEEMLSPSQNAPPKIPLDVAVKSHWLAIEGVQPAIPENPPPISKEIQLKDTVDPSINKPDELNFAGDIKALKDSLKSSSSNKKDKNKDDSKKQQQQADAFKPLITHELSVEQQLYYKEITEACVGSNEVKRTEALQSLSNDPGLYQLLPRFTTFIAEGVKVNVAQHNLALLIYLLRMIKSLMENATLYVEKYLHDLIPAVVTCVVSRQLCPRPDFDNHWALRDFAARLLAQMCKHFSAPANNIQSRVTKILCKSLFAEKSPLASHYGAVAGLAELGLEAIKFLILPRLKSESEIILEAMESTNPGERAAGERLQTILVKNASIAVVKTRSPPDLQHQFMAEFGYLGSLIHNKVVHHRATLSQAKTPTTPLTPNMGIIK